MHLARRIAAAILAKVDLELPVVLPTTDGLDGLDGVGDVGEIDEGAALFTESVDELNLTILGEVLTEMLLCEGLVQVANVHIP